MESRIVERKGMLLAGLAANVTLGDVESGLTIQLSEQFNTRRSEINNEINTREVFGLSTDPENYNPETDKFEFFIGVEVAAAEELPDGMVYREVQPSEYVVFSFEGAADNAGPVHHYLYSTWLNNSDYQLASSYNIEVYDERNKGPHAADSITDIYFPIVKK
ncbi:putative transcriptional regulator YdeE [Paenibacillus cellulosilyticus]|uniref:Putative transcriptional regulator YdeE n=1 Tax=Paenibacillus cellulosilyticus TaxID=375489 RepID=A0A2V2YLJ3_9BACL|nr:GyrI-like domain-containing protein [Paenibacillus cellulosilyticus]PWV94499.1 putative transcriptional regulator YdeE [Paenibacillus cellulosilyticus]QKS45009.1 AraC family transcriptional regulator [Paenibacillus cellulosilyticus]